MSDGFPSRSCVDAILSHGEVGADADRFPASVLVFGRGRKTNEVRTRLTHEPKALWTMMRVGLWIVVQGSDRGRPGCSRRR
jgi:hypothetical protein